MPNCTPPTARAGIYEEEPPAPLDDCKSIQLSPLSFPQVGALGFAAENVERVDQLRRAEGNNWFLPLVLFAVVFL